MSELAFEGRGGVRQTGDRSGKGNHRLIALRRRGVWRVAIVSLLLTVSLNWNVAAAWAGASPTPVGSVANPSSLSGASYVTVSGNYAYTTAYYAGTLTVVDISNPSAPQVVGQSPFSSGLLNGSSVTVSGHYAYAISQNRNKASGTGINDDGTGNSLTILDISNPTAPTIVGMLKDANALFGAHGVAVSGSYVYVAAQGCLSGQPCTSQSVGNSLVVIDASNPASPAIVSTLRNSSLPAPWTGTNALQHACGIAVSGNYAYITASYAHRVTIVDISDPVHPMIVGSVQDSNLLQVPVDVAVRAGYAYVVNEVVGSGRVTVLDVHDPTLPTIAGSVASAALSGAYRIRLRSNFAYVAATYAPAMSVLDISDPTKPRVAGSFQSASLLNRTVGIDLDPTAQYAISTSPWLSTETRTLYPPFPIQPGGPAATGTLSAIQLDPLPIGVTISSKPPSITTSPTATFSFAANDDVSTVRCQLDGAPPTLCGSATGQSYTSLAQTTHTFVVTAIDAADRVATASYTWTVSGQPPPGNLSMSTPVLDNFNRANGPAGGNWLLIKSTGFATMNVSGNAAVDSSTTSYAWNYWNAASFGPDSEVYATIASSVGSDTVRIGARVTPGSSYTGYFVSVSGSGVWSIIRMDKTVPVTLATGPTQPLAVGDQIGIRIVGTIVTALRYAAASGWTRMVTYDTSVDTTRYSTGGRFAIEFRAGALDDFGGGNISVPVNTQAPSVSGTAEVGSQLTATAGNWTGSPTPTFTYQWQDCDTNGANCSPISGATGSVYTVALADAGFTIEVVVTATNSAGGSQAGSAPTALVPTPQPPLNNQPPTVTGTVAVGEQLTATAGGWTGSPAPTFAYQWQDCDTNGANCNPIDGAIGASYTIVAADIGFTIEVLVTATNTAGTNQAASSPTNTIPAVSQPPLNNQPPTVTGTATVGNQLTATAGNWTGSPTPTFTYQWQDCDTNGANCNPISNATNTTYTITNQDIGFTIEVLVTATNTAGTNQAASSPTNTIPAVSQPPLNNQPPTVTGTATVGNQLTATAGNWTGSPTPTFTYQWQDCDTNGANCNPISNATNTTYTITNQDIGFTIEVLVTATNTAGTNQAASSPTNTIPAVSQPPLNNQPPTVTGTATVGNQLTATAGNWTGSPTPTFTYQWQDCDTNGANCNPISNATNTTYTITNQDIGFTIEVLVTATNTAGTNQAASSPTNTIPAVSQPPLNNQPPTVTGTATVGNQLTATAGNWTGSPTPTFTYQWQDCDTNGANCNPISNATNTTYTITNQDIGFTIEVLVTATNTAGTNQAASSPTNTIPAVSQPPLNNQPPTVTGTATVGNQLTATAGNWTGSPTPTFTYQWQDCDTNGANCSPISNATNTTYTITNQDIGFTIEVLVTATNTAGTNQAASSPTNTIPAVSQPPLNNQPPTVTGTATVGNQLTATAGNWTGSPTPTFTYQWQDCDTNGANCSPISNATNTTYTITNQDIGFTIEVLVTATNTAGTNQAASSPTNTIPAVSQPPLNNQPPTVTGTATVGNQLTATAGNWTGSPTPTFTYQWQDCDTNGANCNPISNATNTTYTITNQDIGFTIEVLVTATNTAGTNQAASSPTNTIPAPAPTTPVLDNFNRANGAAGGNWSLLRSSGFAKMNVSGNTAVDSSSSQYAWNYWTPATFGPDAEAYATIANSTGGDAARIGARVTPGNTYSGYFVSVSGTGAWSIIRIDNGGATPVTLASGVTQQLAVGDKFAIRIVGSTIRALHFTPAGGWAQVLTYNTASDTIRYTAAGRVALEFRAGAFDDFGGGSI